MSSERQHQALEHLLLAVDAVQRIDAPLTDHTLDSIERLITLLSRQFNRYQGIAQTESEAQLLNELIDSLTDDE